MKYLWNEPSLRYDYVPEDTLVFEIKTLSFWEKLWWAEKIHTPINFVDLQETSQWLEDNCIGKYKVTHHAIRGYYRLCYAFKKKSDALMFKLRWMN